MLDESLSTRWFRGALACAGLGLVAGALEMVGLAASLRLPLGFGGFALLGVQGVLAMGIVGLLAGGVAGVVHLAIREEWPSRALSLQAALAAVLLCGWYLWEAAATLWGDGRAPAAAIMAVMPLVFGAVVYFNAAYWWRRRELGAETRIGWLAVAAVVSAVVALGAAAGHALRSPGGSGALKDDPNVLLITVDGLAHADVYGPGAPAAGLAEGALRYLDVVTPVPESRPGNATVLTALHPLRNGVITDTRRLAAGRTTLAEALGAEGWATAAFVSSSTLDARSGLDQGFRTYDDAVRAGPRGLWRLSVMRRLGVGGEAHREAAATTDHALAWLEAHRGVPFFVWVHYDAPARDPAGGAAAVAVEVGRLEQALAAWGLSDATLRVVAGTFGGADGGAGLSEARVQVPVLIRAPGVAAVVTDITPQVRLMDVAPTVLEYVEIEGMEPVEGVDLLGYALRVRHSPMWCSLVGRGGADPSATALIGLRNNGVKYVREVRTGVERLYDLGDDPGETTDLSATHAETLEQARGLVAPEETALRGLLREGS